MLPEFAEAIRNKADPFSCIGPLLFNIVKDPMAVRIINDFNAALFIFGAMDIDGVLHELSVSTAEQPPNNQHGDASSATLAALNAITPFNSDEPLDSKQCDDATVARASKTRRSK